MGRALQFIRKKLNLPEPKPQPRPNLLWLLVGAGVLVVALLGGVLYYATADGPSESGPEPAAPSNKVPAKAPLSVPASTPARETPRSRPSRHPR
jgi:hypothetical protein